MSRFMWISLGTIAATSGAIAGASYVHRRRQAAASPDEEAPPSSKPEPSIPAPKPSSLTPLAWDGAGSLPTAADVKGDLTRNWGRTPPGLRPQQHPGRGANPGDHRLP